MHNNGQVLRKHTWGQVSSVFCSVFVSVTVVFVDPSLSTQHLFEHLRKIIAFGASLMLFRIHGVDLSYLASSSFMGSEVATLPSAMTGYTYIRWLSILRLASLLNCVT